MADGGTALRAFVVGHPVSHSLSPRLHGYWLREYGIAGTYQAVDIQPENIEAFITDLKSGVSGFVGGNVTIPYKEAAFGLADEADETARRLGAANTLSVHDGRLLASNTDGYGFLANLDASAPGWASGSGRAVVLGAGGASRAVLQALIDRGFERIDLVNRTPARAEELARRFGPKVRARTLEELSERLHGAGFFVNTSALGMTQGAVPDLDFTVMADAAVVADIVYNPLVTPFLRQAAGQGRPTVDGLGMLLHQAVPGFEKWFGRRPVVTDALRAHVLGGLTP